MRMPCSMFYANVQTILKKSSKRKCPACLTCLNLLKYSHNLAQRENLQNESIDCRLRTQFHDKRIRHNDLVTAVLAGVAVHYKYLAINHYQLLTMDVHPNTETDYNKNDNQGMETAKRFMVIELFSTETSVKATIDVPEVDLRPSALKKKHHNLRTDLFPQNVFTDKITTEVGKV